MKRALLLLFAAVFTLSAVGTASAQPNKSSHDVEINVSEINKLSVSGAPTITISSNLNTWVADGGSGKLTVTTNATSNRKITVSSVTVKQGDLTSLGLRVSADNAFGGSKQSIKITTTGSNNTNTGGSLISGFQIENGGVANLTYEAKASVNYDPSTPTKVNVQYTLTAQ